MKIKWLNKPQKHDYPAAASYLSLIMGIPAAKNTPEKLKKAEMTKFAAKDIFRSSGLSLLLGYRRVPPLPSFLRSQVIKWHKSTSASQKRLNIYDSTNSLARPVFDRSVVVDPFCLAPISAV
jgi:hypothetical protein